MQVLALNSRIMLRPTVRVKIKRRLKEAVRLIVTRGAAVEESRKGPKVVFRAEDVGADKWIAPGVLLLLLFHARAQRFVVLSVLLLTMGFHADWTYVASPTSEMFRVSFSELVNSMRQALVFLHRCIPEAERILRYSSERENGGATSLPYVAKNCFYDPLRAVNQLEFPARIGKRTQLAIGLLTGRLGAPQVITKFILPGSFDRFANAKSPLPAECERMAEFDGKKYDVFLYIFLPTGKELNHIWFVRGDETTVLEYCMS